MNFESLIGNFSIGKAKLKKAFFCYLLQFFYNLLIENHSEEVMCHLTGSSNLSCFFSSYFCVFFLHFPNLSTILYGKFYIKKYKVNPCILILLEVYCGKQFLGGNKMKELHKLQMLAQKKVHSDVRRLTFYCKTNTISCVK